MYPGGQKFSHLEITGLMEYDCDFRYISKEVTINSGKFIWVKRKEKEKREGGWE